MLAIVFIINQLMNFGALDGFFAAAYGGQPRLSILDTTFTPIALGVSLAHLLHGRGTFGALYRLFGHRGASVVFGAVLFALIVFWPGDISGLGRLLIQLAMTLALGAIVVREDHWARPVLAFPPLAYLGAISYGVYLYHMWVIHLVHVGFERLGGDLTGIGFFIAAVLASTAVASLSYRLIEQPLLKLKARFASDGDSLAGTLEATRPTAETVAQ